MPEQNWQEGMDKRELKKGKGHLRRSKGRKGPDDVRGNIQKPTGAKDKNPLFTLDKDGMIASFNDTSKRLDIFGSNPNYVPTFDIVDGIVVGMSLPTTDSDSPLIGERKRAVVIYLSFSPSVKPSATLDNFRRYCRKNGFIPVPVQTVACLDEKGELIDIPNDSFSADRWIVFGPPESSHGEKWLALARMPFIRDISLPITATVPNENTSAKGSGPEKRFKAMSPLPEIVAEQKSATKEMEEKSQIRAESRGEEYIPPFNGNAKEPTPTPSREFIWSEFGLVHLP